MDTVSVRRDKITSELRDYILKRDEYACRYCGAKNVSFHLDHVYPVVKGGETSTRNLVTACSKCNSKKHSSIGMWPKPIGYFDYKRSHRLHLFLSPTILGTLITILWLLALSESSSLLRDIELWSGLVCSLPLVFENIKYMLSGEI